MQCPFMGINHIYPWQTSESDGLDGWDLDLLSGEAQESSVTAAYIRE